MNPIAELIAADEGFNHQIIDTFATVGTSDPSWTEKVCAMAMAADGSLQIGFGLGKYTNRNVMDAYAAVSRGPEQWTTRASRRLAPHPDLTNIGPISYEVIEPFKTIRFVLEPNDAQPIAFDWTFTAELPPQMEERTFLRGGYRTSAELVRYHQIGVSSGWIQVDGERHEMSPDSWVSTRDHSWGVRYDVGIPAVDVEGAGAEIPAGVGFQMLWSPTLLTRADGTKYGVHLHFTKFAMPGFEQMSVTSKVENPDGTFEAITTLQPELTFDPVNRRFTGGRLVATMPDGSERPFLIDVLSETGVHLGAGLYFGFDGHHHGSFRGELHIEGEYFADCREPENARRLHQIRDTAIRITDPVGGGTGVGNCQTIAAGPWPELGLADENWM